MWAVARNICALNGVKVPACAGQHAPVWATLSTASGLDGCLPCVAATCVSRSRVPEFVPSDDDVSDDHDSDGHDSDDSDDSDDATIGVAFTLVGSVLICKRLDHHERFAAALLKAVLEVFEQYFLARADDVAVAQKIAAVGAGLMARTLLKGASLVSLGSNDPDAARAVRELTSQSVRHLAALQNPAADLCAGHPGEQKNLWCETCSATICRDCIVVDHRDHDYDFLNKMFDKHHPEMVAALRTRNQAAHVLSAALTKVRDVEDALQQR